MKHLLFMLMLCGHLASAELLSVSYEVPVDEPALKPHATFFAEPGDLAHYGFDGKRMEFSLPAALLGKKRTFVIQQQSGDQWSGEHVSGACTQQQDLFVCRVHFEGLHMDLAAVEAVLRTKSADEAQVQAGLLVATRFGNEWDGIIRLHFKN